MFYFSEWKLVTFVFHMMLANKKWLEVVTYLVRAQYQQSKMC